MVFVFDKILFSQIQNRIYFHARVGSKYNNIQTVLFVHENYKAPK